MGWEYDADMVILLPVCNRHGNSSICRVKGIANSSQMVYGIESKGEMGMNIRKSEVNKLIAITKKYFKSGDTDLLPAMREMESNIKERRVSSGAVETVTSLARISQNYGTQTYEQIYAATMAMGHEIEEDWFN